MNVISIKDFMNYDCHKNYNFYEWKNKMSVIDDEINYLRTKIIQTKLCCTSKYYYVVAN